MKKNNPAYLEEIENDGLDYLILSFSRLFVVLKKISEYNCLCPEEESEYSNITNETKKIIRELYALKDAEVHTIADAIKSAQKALKIINSSTLPVIPQSFFLRPGASEIVSAISLPAPPSAMLASVDLTKLIDPTDIIKLLEILSEMIKYWLSEFAVDATPEQKEKLKLLLAGLEAFIVALKQGGKVGLDEIINFLRIFLKEFLTILRQTMSKEAFEEILKQLLKRFLTPLAELIGESAGAAFLWIALTIIAGAAIGIGIGYLIGSIKIGDKTIWEHWGDIFYDWFYAPPDDCALIFELYLKAKADRKKYESSGTTLDKSIMKSLLITERDLLQRYIDLKCETNTKVYENEVNRLNEKLKKL